MTTVEQYIKNYNTNSYIRKNMREILEDYIADVLNSIDDTLCDLQDDVLSGTYTNHEIADKISSIRRLIF